MEDYRKRVLLLMNYDNRNTLTENTEKILLEAVVPGQGLTKILRTLISVGEETLGKVIRKTEPEIEAFARKASYTVDEIDDLFRSIKNNKLLAEELFKDFALLSRTQLDSTVDTLVTEVAANPNEYRKIVDAFVDNYMLHLDLPESAKPLITEYANLVVKKVKNKLKITYPDVYRKLFKAAGEISKNNSLKSIMSSIMKSMNKQDIQTILRAYSRVLRPMELLQAEFNKLAKDASIKMNSNPPLSVDYEFKKMGDILAAAKKRWDASAKDLYQQWVSDPQFPKGIKKELDNVTDDNKFQYVYQELKKNKDILYGMNSEWEAYKKLWPFKLPNFFTGSANKGWGIFKSAEPDDKLIQRWFNLILYKDPRLISEWKNAMLASGAPSDIIRNIISRMALDAFVLPAAYSVIGLGFRPIIAGAENLYNTVQWGKEDLNWIDYNELNKSGVPTIVKEDFLKCINDTMPSGVKEWIETVVDPSYLDELWRNVYKPLVNYASGNNKEEDKEKAQEAIRKIEEENKAKLRGTSPCYDENKSFDENLKAILECQQNGRNNGGNDGGQPVEPPVDGTDPDKQQNEFGF